MIPFIESIFSTPYSLSLIANVGVSLMIILVLSLTSLDSISKLSIKHDWNLANLVLSVGLVALFSIMVSGRISLIFFLIILLVFGGLGFNVDGAALEKELAESDSETTSFDLLADPQNMVK